MSLPPAPMHGGRAAAEGLPGELGALAAAYGAEIAILASLVLQQRHAAETVVDRSLVEAFRERRLPETDPDRRLAVLRIAVRRTLEVERRSGAVDPLLLDPVIADAGGTVPGSSAGGAIPPAAIVAAMATLPARDRAAIALRHALELDPEQIAVVTRAPAARCAARLRDARDRLQEMLEGSQPIGVIEEITDGH